MIYNISYENGRTQVETSSEVLEIIRQIRQISSDKKATCINIGTALYNLDLWLLPIKNLAFLFFESIYKENSKAKGKLIPIDEAMQNMEYIMENNDLSQNEEWHSCS